MGPHLDSIMVACISLEYNMQTLSDDHVKIMYKIALK